MLPSGSGQRLTAVNNAVYGPTGTSVVRSVITIAANNSRIRRAVSAPEFRILAVGYTGNLILRCATITGGRATTDVTEPFGFYLESTGGGCLRLVMESSLSPTAPSPAIPHGDKHARRKLTLPDMDVRESACPTQQQTLEVA